MRRWARDGSLPAWFGRGERAGEVPRRALAVTAGLSMVSLLATALLHLDLTVSVLLATGAFTVVYVVGTAAAVRLLPRGTWGRRGAVVSFVSVEATPRSCARWPRRTAARTNRWVSHRRHRWTEQR